MNLDKLNIFILRFAKLTEKLADTNSSVFIGFLHDLSVMFGKTFNNQDIDNWINQLDDRTALVSKISECLQSSEYKISNEPGIITIFKLSSTNKVATHEPGYIISKNAQIGNHINNDYYLDVSSVHFIKGFASIPSFYIHEGFVFRNVDKTEIFPAFAGGLKKLFSSKEIEEILDSDKFAQLLNNFTEAPKYLGSGVDGAAFDIGGGKVLKFFRSTYAFQKAIESQNLIFEKGQNAENEVMVYDVGQIGPGFYTIMERLIPVEIVEPKKTKNLFEILKTIYQHTIKEPEYFKKLSEMYKHNSILFQPTFNILVEALVSDNQQTLKEMCSDLNLQENCGVKFIKEVLFKLISGRGDLHLGNLGINDQGYLKYFDPSHPLFSDSMNLQYPLYVEQATMPG